MTKQLFHGDCLEVLAGLPDKSVDLVLTDPPYNIGHTKEVGGKTVKQGWDVIENYIEWCKAWILECQRVLKPNGVLYFWHNDILQISQLLNMIDHETSLAFMSFCIWDKGDSYRAQSWANRDPDSATALRSWFNVCEYCLHFFNAPSDADSHWKHTGLDRINSNPECYKLLKDWYSSEKERLGLDDKQIAWFYTKVTGKKPHMLRHYFRDSQFEIPTQKIWETVYIPLGFGKSCEELRKSYEELRKSYEELRKSYEELRKSYEELRNYHRCDEKHCNVWHHPPVPSTGRLHSCQKPVDILERLIRVSCRDGGTVLDCFMGSGSTGVACANTGRNFIGIEKDSEYFEIARKRIEEVETAEQFVAKL